MIKKNKNKKRKYSMLQDNGERHRLKLLAKYSKGKTLDIGYGCQPNIYIKEAYGLDSIKPKDIPKNYKKTYILNLEKEFQIPTPDNYFDTVIGGEVIEHAPDMTPFLKEIHRVLKPNGTLCLSTPNPSYPLAVLTEFLEWIKGYNFNDGIKGTSHIHIFNCVNMICLLNLNRFKPVKILGTYFNIPYTKIQIPTKIVPFSLSIIFIAKKK